MIVVIDILKFILLIIMTFFSCQVITNNKKRISYIGTILICFSSAVLEYINLGLVEAIFFGEMIFFGIDKLLKNSKYSYIFSFFIPIGILGFFLLSNISFQISIGIVIITLIIWKLLEFYELKKEKAKNEKINKKNLIILILGVIISLVLIILFYKYKSIKSLVNLSGLNYLTNYTYSIFVLDKPYLTTFISIFPIGLFIGIYYIFKDDKNKHSNFIIPTVLVSILQLILLVSNIKLEFIPNYIIALGFSLLQIYMIIYIFSRIEEKFFDLVKSAYITLIGLVLLIFIPYINELNKTFLDVSYIIFVLEAYILLNYSDKRFWRLGSWVFTIICLSETVTYLIVNFL